jgi:hypothetical protein
MGMARQVHEAINKGFARGVDIVIIVVMNIAVSIAIIMGFARGD